MYVGEDVTTVFVRANEKNIYQTHLNFSYEEKCRLRFGAVGMHTVFSKIQCGF